MLSCVAFRANVPYMWLKTEVTQPEVWKWIIAEWKHVPESAVITEFQKAETLLASSVADTRTSWDNVMASTPPSAMFEKVFLPLVVFEMVDSDFSWFSAADSDWIRLVKFYWLFCFTVLFHVCLQNQTNGLKATAAI